MRFIWFIIVDKTGTVLLNVCVRPSIIQCVKNFQPVEWPTTGPMTKKTVEDYCRLKIADSVLGKLCRRFLPITFDKEIEGCMEDVKVRLAVSKTYNRRAHTQKSMNVSMHICIHIYAYTFSNVHRHVKQILYQLG